MRDNERVPWLRVVGVASCNDFGVLTLFAIIAVAGVLFAASVLATKEGDELVDVSPDRADLALPAGRLVAEDLRDVRFTMALRGYRMDEVDVVLDRLGGELAERDVRIAELEMALAAIVEPVVSEVERQQADTAPAQAPLVEAPLVEASTPEPEAEPVPALERVSEPGSEPSTGPAPVTATVAASVILTTPIVETPVILPADPEPVVEEQAVEEVAIEEVAIETPVVGDAAVEEPVVEEAVAEADPAVDELVAPEPVVEVPLAEAELAQQLPDAEPKQRVAATEAEGEPEHPAVTGLSSLFPESVLPESEFPEVAPPEAAPEDLPEATEDDERPDRPL